MNAQLHPETLPELTSSELRRFNRQIILPEFGIEAQRRLKAGSVLLIGLGGLGMVLMPRNKVSQIGAEMAPAVGGKA